MADDTYKEYVSSEDSLTLADIITEDVVRNGVDLDQESLMGAKGFFSQAIQHLFDTTRVALINMQRNTDLLATNSVSHLISQLVQHSDEPTFAMPSTTSLNISIPISYIKQVGKPVKGATNSWEFEYKNTNSVILDDKPFMIDKDSYFIRVTEKPNDTECRVYYKNSLGVATNVLSQKLYLGQGQYAVVFEASFIQTTVETIEKVFTSAELDEFIFATENPIYVFNAEYRDNDASEWEPIIMKLYYTRGIAASLEYAFMSNKSIRVMHQYSNGGFRPIKGGTLRITFLTTTGEDINYSGDPQLGTVVPTGAPISYLSTEDKGIFTSTGGRLADANQDTLRDTVIKMKSTRRRIDTEPDMESWLLPYTGSSKFKPKLNISDFLLRIFNIYTMIKFEQIINTGETQTFTIPSNSGDVLVDLSKVPKKLINGNYCYAIRSDMLVKSIQNQTDSSFELNPTDPYQEGTEKDGIFFYISPFLYTYSVEKGLTRSFMDAQYAEPYKTVAEFESEDERIDTRFVNSTVRVNDYMNEDDKTRTFSITTLVRCDNPDKEISDKNFKAVLTLNDIDDQPFEIQGTVEKDTTQTDEENNMYLITFKMTSDRNIFDRQVDIKYNNDAVTKTVEVDQKAKLSLYLKYNNGTEDEPRMEDILVTRYATDVSLFVEITPSLYIQHNMEYSGKLKLVLCPLISKGFYQIAQNQKTINDELKNVFAFIQKDIYEANDMFSSKGYTLNDLQETLFAVSIKFVKTYGHSSFLNVGNSNTVPLKNLQIKPKLYISKIDQDFDPATISNIFNNEFINWDFLAEDMHMSILCSGVLSNAEDYISALQFVNFDDYPSDYHLIKNNGKEEKNDDVPEVLSIAPKYNKTTKRYEYDITYTEL